MKSKNIYILVLIISVFIAVSFLYLNNLSQKNILNEKIENLSNTGVDISDELYSKQLNESEYKRIWINPEKYNNFNDFLSDLNSFTWMIIDVEKNDFVIAKKTSENWLLYIPFRHEDIDKWEFLNDEMKNIVIFDIYESYKDDKIYWWMNSDVGSKIIFESDLTHPATKELWYVFSWDSNVYDLINDLNSYDKLSSEKTELLSYLNDLVWNYDNSHEIRKKLCSSWWDYCKVDSKVNFY